MFSDIIALYRVLNRPTLTADGTFNFNGQLDAAARELAERCQEMGAQYGEVELVDTPEGTALIEGRFPMNGHGRAYVTRADLIHRSPSLAFGQLPGAYYVASLDYYSGDADKPDEIGKVEKLVKFIELLSTLADDRVDFNSSTNRLLFILPSAAGKIRRTALVQVDVEEKALAYELSHLQLLEELVAENNADKLHIEERLLTMRSAIGEVLADADEDTNHLTFLCANWREIRQKYRSNFQAYINDFAFDEVRKKIVDAELEYTSKLTGAYGDITGKLLALPASLVAVIALDSATTTSTFVLGCLGLLIVTLVMWLMLCNFSNQVEQLRSGFDFIFSPLFDKSSTYPSKLKNVLQTRKDALRKQSNLTRGTFIVFYALALTPTAGAIWKLWQKYPTEFAAIWDSTVGITRMITTGAEYFFPHA